MEEQEKGKKANKQRLNEKVSKNRSRAGKREEKTDPNICGRNNEDENQLSK